MNLFSLGLLFLAAVQVPQVSAAASAVTAPTCGLECIVTAIVQNSTCAVTNTTCICSSVSLNAAAEACIMESCSIRDKLATQRYSKTTCGVKGEDRTRQVWIIGIVFAALGFFAFCLRVAARLVAGPQRTWGLDDWFMTAAVILMIPLGVLSYPLAKYGLGLDIWNVDPDNITRMLFVYFWSELLYVSTLPLTKISILFFYLKIFPKRSIKIACWVLIGLNIGYLISFLVVSIIQCIPIPGAWLSWDGTYKATCHNVNMQGWMAAILNLVLDLAVLILPMPELASLSLSMRKKLQILLMFGVGFFVTIVSLIRLQSLAKYASTKNMTQDYVEIGYWSTIEVPVGIICACMPAIRSLFALMNPKVFGTTQKQVTDYQGNSKSSKQWSFGKSTANGNIKVQTEWTVRSHHLGESSQVELVPIQTMPGASSSNFDVETAGQNYNAQHLNP